MERKTLVHKLNTTIQLFIGANPHTLSANVCVPFMKPWLSKNAIQVHNKSVSSGIINKENP